MNKSEILLKHHNELIDLVKQTHKLKILTPESKAVYEQIKNKFEVIKEFRKQAGWKETALAGLLAVTPLVERTAPAIKTPAAIVKQLTTQDSLHTFFNTLRTKAKAKGLNPTLVQAMAKVEGGKYPHRMTNPLQMNMRYSKQIPNAHQLTHEQKQNIMVDQALTHLKNKMSQYKNQPLLTQIQAYNGLGKLPTRKYLRAYKEFLPKKFRNSATRPRDIDMAKYQPYAKKVLRNME